MTKSEAKRWACRLVGGMMTNYIDGLSIDEQCGETWNQRERDKVLEAVNDLHDELDRRAKPKSKRTSR